ncbi:MAG: hypothetical protein LBH06_00655 [Rikenellaceae bacterium]|nr:hypothetical protein [Rikenellaceae bacterium]
MKKYLNPVAVVALCAALAATTSCTEHQMTENDHVNPPAVRDTLAITPAVNSIVFEANATTSSSTTFTVATNGSSWNAVASGGNWVTIDMDKTNKTFTVTADVNYNPVEPSPVTVTVTAGSAIPVNITLTQKAAAAVTTCNNVSGLCGRTLFIEDIDETNLPAGEQIDSIRIMLSPFPAGGSVFFGSAPYVNKKARLTLPETIEDKYITPGYWGIPQAEQGAKSNIIRLYAYSNGNFIGLVKLCEWDSSNNKYTYVFSTYMYANKNYTLNHSAVDYLCQMTITKGWNSFFTSPPIGTQKQYIYTNQPNAGSVFKWKFN